MKLDFWNNPIVVSAFRVKYRRGGLFNFTMVYLLVLVAGGMLLHYYNDRFVGPFRAPFPRNYLLAILAVQFAVSYLFASSATSASLRAEVVNRTLDFQRIAALSPRQILLGKLLGEPALAYLLAIATIPLTAWCWMMGVAGVSLDVLVLLYVLLAASTFLMGTIGLLQRLDPPDAKKSGGNAGAAAGVGGGIFLLIFLPPILSSVSWLMSTPWSAALVGLTTPIPVFFGLAEGNPWKYCLSFYGIQIPFLLVMPLFQLLLAGLCFQTMVRRLINPLNTSFSKPLAYGTLLAVDLLTAAVLHDPNPIGRLAVGPRSATFCLVHLIAGIFLLDTATPWRESLESWVWRLRGRSSRFWDLLLGERSANVLVLLTFCVIGWVGLLLFVLLPATWLDGAAAVQDQQQLPIALSAMTATTMLMLGLGMMSQWFVFLAGRSGRSIFTTMCLGLILPLHLVGHYYRIDFLLALTPSAHFAGWFRQNPLPHLEYLLILYGTVLILSGCFLWQHLGRLEKAIDQKLQEMGVRKLAG
jgi:hypothetical protein